MPRDPLWSMSQTESSSSRQTSMKWFPVPSVARCARWFALRSAGCFSTSASSRGASGAQASADGRGRVGPGAPVVPAAVVGPAVRHGALDRGAHGVEVVREVARRKVGLQRHHPAADVDADRGRDDRAERRDDAPDRRPDPEVDVGHRRHPLVDEREAGDVRELLLRLGLERDAPRPALHRDAARDVGHVEVTVGHGFSRTSIPYRVR